MKKQISIRPEVTILSVLKHLNYKPWFALAEFVDNSLQSSLANKSVLQAAAGKDYVLKVEIEINLDGEGRIVVKDNAAGISIHDFPRAFRAAEIPTDTRGLSEFGMGMKSAACWFARKWKVRTKAIDDSVEREIEFDLEKIVKNRLESLGSTERSAHANSHYTEVLLLDLHHLPKGRTLSKIKDHLASIYRVFIRDGRLRLFFNGEELSYATPEVLKTEINGAPVIWKKSINFDFGEGQRVSGFAALRETGNSQLAGFSLFRRDRLIEGSCDETYRPRKIFQHLTSYRNQRLFGELHLEGFDVSHTKDGFRWEDYEEIFLDCLEEELCKAPINLLQQADNYRAKASKSSVEEIANLATESVANAVIQGVTPVLKYAAENHGTGEQLPIPYGRRELASSERIVQIDDGTYLWEITIRTNVDQSEGRWLTLGRDQKISTAGGRLRYLAIDVSLVHPFSARFVGADLENVELFLRFAVGIGISLELTADVSGAEPQCFLSYFNDLFGRALTQRWEGK